MGESESISSKKLKNVRPTRHLTVENTFLKKSKKKYETRVSTLTTHSI
jgi:hypothetical protein